MLRCSVNGLPVHVRLPHRISRAYSVSSSGRRTLRTCVYPMSGLMVRRIYPRLLSGWTRPTRLLHVLVEQLGHGDGRVGLPPGLGYRWWGGWGSNPRPADYEKYGPVHRVR